MADPTAYARAVTEAVERALAEDLVPKETSLRPWCPRTCRPSSLFGPGGPGCWRAVTAPPRPSDSWTPTSTCAGRAEDGDELAAGDTLLELAGLLRPILTGERTALNFLGRLSGVATLTAQFVTAAHESNPSVAVLDTRKTTPGLRLLEKAAVRAGGGTNHRAGLSDAILVKDNHLAGISIADAVQRARVLWPGKMIEIECDTLDQVAQAARAGADAVLLDNMDPGTWSRPLRWRTWTRPGRSSPKCPAT